MAQAVRDLMTGDLMMTMPLLTHTLMELHASGRIKILAITSTKRLGVAPDIPTAIEAGVPSMVAAEYFYLFAPAGTPISILTQLNDDFRCGPDRRRIPTEALVAGFDPLFSGDLTETRVMFESERTRWLPIAKATGLQIN